MNETGLENTLKSLIEQTYIVEKQYKNLNSSYKELQKFTQSIIESMGAAIWVEKNGKILLSNSLASKNEKLFNNIDKNKNNQELEFNGKFFTIKITQKDENKIILATDITDEKRSARLVSMGAVAAHLSHEIRNPLGSVSLLTSTLLKRADEKNKPVIEEMQKGIFRVERIIKATLLFAKGVHITKSTFDLKKLEIASKNAIKNYAYSKEIDFKFEGFNGLIDGDFDLLDMVFSNFIFNAIDAIEDDENEDGLVEIFHSINEDGEHEFIVKDSGVKIDSNAIFEPFKTTKLKGNGLGLALSIEIINAHLGSLALQNEPKFFTITLP